MNDATDTYGRAGYLMEWKRAPVDKDWPPAERFSISTIAHGWEELVFRPLAEEAKQFKLTAGQEYLILRRRGARRFILLSSERTAIDCALALSRLRWQIAQVHVDVPRLVTTLINAPCDYSVGAVWARVEGYGQKLRTIGLFGDDLTETDLFRRLVMDNHLTCFRVSLRDVRRAVEVLSISYRGELSMRLINDSSLLSVQEGVRFLAQGGFINDPNGGVP